ncbi:MAG: PqqD family protein [Bacteroidaceae bacterium]|nr:PqqD family protein [Bacteroidaceae bacterium]
MKVKKGFELQEVCGEFIIVPAGIENVDFSKIISLNETAADIWKSVAEMNEFSIDDMVSILMEQYEVDEQTAREDCSKIAELWKEMGLTE